jgi:hypothetical protein
LAETKIPEYLCIRYKENRPKAASEQHAEGEDLPPQSDKQVARGRIGPTAPKRQASSLQKERFYRRDRNQNK